LTLFVSHADRMLVQAGGGSSGLGGQWTGRTK